MGVRSRKEKASIHTHTHTPFTLDWIRFDVFLSFFIIIIIIAAVVFALSFSLCSFHLVFKVFDR